MTPRIKELDRDSDLSWFSQELLTQLPQNKSEHLLTGQGRLFELFHPALIKCRHLFLHSPNDLIFTPQSGAWNLQLFKNPQEAEAKIGKIKSYGGFPFQIFQFLQDDPNEAFLHFDQLGSIFLSKTASPRVVTEKLELHHHMLPLWLDYALSTELWGPAGKWPRFHSRLHTLFEKYGLLIEQDLPGFYPLKKEAHWLSNHGFKGKLSQTNFDLVLTWDFPLSAVIELEKVLAREP